MSPGREATAAGARPKVLFVGAFPPPGRPIFGGNVSDCAALMASSFPQRLDLVLLDSTREAVGAAGKGRRLRRAATRTARLVRLVHVEKPDALLVFASSGASFVEKGLYAAYGRLLGIPTILSIRSGHFMDDCRRSRAFRAVARLLLAFPARLLCQGRHWQELFEGTFGIPASRCSIVDGWVASDDLLRIGRERVYAPAEPVTVLFLGVLERFKGVFDLLEVVGRLRADPQVPRFVVSVCGAGSAEAELRRRVEGSGLASLVRFDGLVTGEAKLEALRRADVFVLPSYTEGLPNAMIEAMAGGLPVVVTPVGSVPDVIVHEENGLFVSPRDPQALEGGMRRLLVSPELRRRLGSEAHRVAASRFTVEAAAVRLEQLLREVVSGGARPQRRPG